MIGADMPYKKNKCKCKNKCARRGRCIANTETSIVPGEMAIFNTQHVGIKSLKSRWRVTDELRNLQKSWKWTLKS